MYTKSLTYWTFFFIIAGISPSYTDIQPSYDLSPNHTPIIATISTPTTTRIPAPRLHTAHTDWKLYKTIINDKLATAQKLKTREDIELATTKIIDILQKAAKTATLDKNNPRHAHHLPSHTTGSTKTQSSSEVAKNSYTGR
jgi:hypothetical protein